jgi:ABC-2 type transport system ATP-binding protein
MARRPNSAIIVEDVKKSFGDVHALKGVSLSADAGKIFGFLGPNGAGKTTLVRILTTLLAPDSGYVEVAGVDVVKNKDAVRHLIGLAGQYPAVDALLTGRENLELVGRLYHFSRKDAKRRADELLERFTLTDAANRQAKTYSGGMRRRLDLAASLVARPQVLFLDEPTTGLDPRTRIDAWETIREMVADGTTILLTTQYLEEADELANYIAIIDHGRIIEEGTADELKSRLGSERLDVEVVDHTQLEAAAHALAQIGSEAPNIDYKKSAISVTVDDGTQGVIQAVRALDSLNIQIAEIASHRPTLDDVFLSITGKPSDTKELETLSAN